METRSDPKPDVTLDMSGLTCPGPILGAKKVVDDLQAGQILMLVSDCPGSRDDLFAWARQTGNRIVATRKLDGARVAYYLQKGHAGAIKAHAVLDMRGVTCPGPIIEAKHLLNGMKPGEVLLLVSNCPGIRADLAEWTRVTGMKLLDTVEVGPGEFEFYVGKP
jgi:TusA-related sulfurtransferase